jgi:hypothetical protein
LFRISDGVIPFFDTWQMAICQDERSDPIFQNKALNIPTEILLQESKYMSKAA